MPSRLEEELAEASGLDNPTDAFKKILGNIKQLSTPSTLAADLTKIADSVIEGGGGIVFTRSVLSQFIDTLKSFENHPDLWIEAGQHVVDAIAGNTSLASSLLEQSAALRELIAAAHEANEDFLDAAKALAEIPLDSSQRRVSDAAKASIWVRIVRNYLEVDDSTAAETYLNKLKNVMHTVDNPELQLHFKLSAARIQDSKRQFLAAAQSYHDISFTSAIAEEERLHTLGMAIKCAILAPAGPPRSRVLGRLYKDERSAGLEEYGILEKMFLDRLLAPAEVDKFAQGLAPHQLATTSDGSTVLAKAVVEHNLLGASRLYSNIGFDALGLLLDLDGDKAEDTTAKMIEQGRLTGSIDQIDRIIYFENREASGEKGSGRAEVLVGKEMRRWDGNVQAVAEDVERLADALQTEFPEFVAGQIAV
jgi:COP9 signalosome complex subunit 4